MRDISMVIDQILAVTELPDACRDRITSLRKRTLYTAPEIQGNCWCALSDILQAELGTADTDWKHLVSNIMIGNSHP